MEDRQKQKYMNIGRMIIFSAFAVCAVAFLFLRFSEVTGAVKKVFSVLTPFFVGIILCYLTYTLYDLVREKTENLLRRWFLNRSGEKSGEKPENGGSDPKKERRCVRWARVAASAVTVLAVLFVITGVVALIIPNLVDSLSSLFSQAPGYISKFAQLEEQFLSSEFLFKDLLVRAYESLTEYLNSYGENEILPNIDKIVSSVAASVLNVASFVYNFVIGIIVMVYLLNGKETLLAGAKRLLYALFPKKADGVCDKVRRFHNTFRAFLVGKLLDSLIIGILCFICLSILKMPYVLLISVIVGVTNIIPFFGPFIGAIPSACLITIISPKQGLLFVIFIFALQQFDGNILGPKILGDRVRISSLAVLFSIILFGGLFGVAGMVLAVPVWVFLTDLVDEVVDSRLKRSGYRTDLENFSSGIRPAAAEAEEKAPGEAEQPPAGDRME